MLVRHPHPSLPIIHERIIQESNVKRTFQPSTTKRKRRHGYRARAAHRAGRQVLRRRRTKGRRRLSA